MYPDLLILKPVLHKIISFYPVVRMLSSSEQILLTIFWAGVIEKQLAVTARKKVFNKRKTFLVKDYYCVS